jgi:hypothetical protein
VLQLGCGLRLVGFAVSDCLEQHRKLVPVLKEAARPVLAWLASRSTCPSSGNQSLEENSPSLSPGAQGFEVVSAKVMEASELMETRALRLRLRSTLPHVEDCPDKF